MQLKSLLLSALFAASVAYAAVNEPCYGAGGAPGVCVSTSSCKASGGKYISNACPRDASNIKCCTKPDCKGTNGNCRWASDCKGSSLSNQCPGPSGFKCCQSKANGFGGYGTPKIPSASNACKAVSVNGAKRVVKAWPGRIRAVGCSRGCKCTSTSSDHCCGKAIDLMCSDKTEVMASTSGKQIAEWVMKNHKTMQVKYVIWGQRIWAATEKQKSWGSWRPMDDRDNVRENHWDHVHVSFK